MDKLECMRFAGKVNRSAIEVGFAAALIPGRTLLEIDKTIEDWIVVQGCKPAFKNYQPGFSSSPFPGTACLSVNDAAVHGIPNSYVLKPGDILTIDVGTEYEGWFVDAARTRIIPGIEPSKTLVNLMEGTEAIMAAELEVVRDGCTFFELIEAAERAAQAYNIIILHQYGGHQIGDRIHIPPFIPNAINRNESKIKQWSEEVKYKEQKLSEGQIICLEPVASYGSSDIIVDADGWTVRKRDGNPVAHTERCLLVKQKGYELLS